MKWNLACGNKKRDGYWHIDASLLCRPDEIADLIDPRWWQGKEDNSVDEMLVEHFLEHIPHQIPDRHVYGSMVRETLGYETKDGLIWFMEQVYRVLVDGGIVEVAFPHYQSHAAYSDPTHCRIITEHTFGYFDAILRPVRGHGHYLIDTDFEMQPNVQYGLMDHIDAEGMTKQKLDLLCRDHWNVVWEQRHWLTAHKPMRKHVA